MVAAVIVKLDELADRTAQFLRAAVDQQVDPRLQRLVKALDLPVGLRMMRRAANVPDGQHSQVILEGMR